MKFSDYKILKQDSRELRNSLFVLIEKETHPAIKEKIHLFRNQIADFLESVSDTKYQD